MLIYVGIIDKKQSVKLKIPVGIEDKTTELLNILPIFLLLHAKLKWKFAAGG